MGRIRRSARSTTTAWLLRSWPQASAASSMTLVLSLPLMAANLHHAFLLDLVLRLAAVLGLLTGNALLRLGIELVRGWRHAAVRAAAHAVRGSLRARRAGVAGRRAPRRRGRLCQG